MEPRASVSLEVPGLALSYEGDPRLFDLEVRPLLEGLARGAWRGRGALVAPPRGPEEASSPFARPDGAPPLPAADPLPALPATARADAPVAIAPVPPPAPPSVNVDFRTLLAALAGEKGRRSEREAVLAALAGLATEGRRDATPSQVVAWLEEKGFPVGGLRPRPILAKLCHRKGLAVPGLLRDTYRATPAGLAHAARLARDS